MTILTANAIKETHSSAWFQLEGTDQSLPLLRSTTTGVLNEELLAQDSHGSPLLQELQILTSSCIMLCRTAAKEFRGSIVEVGAKTQTLTAQFTGCIHTFYTPSQFPFPRLIHTLVFETGSRVPPIAGKDLVAQTSALVTAGLFAALSFGRIHSEMIGLPQGSSFAGYASLGQGSPSSARSSRNIKFPSHRKKTLPEGKLGQRRSTSCCLQAREDHLTAFHEGGVLVEEIPAGVTTMLLVAVLTAGEVY